MTPSSNSAQVSRTVHDDFALGKALDDLHTLSALLTATMKVAEPGSDAERCLKVGAALVRWINDGVITPLIKGPSD